LRQQYVCGRGKRGGGGAKVEEGMEWGEMEALNSRTYPQLYSSR